VTRVDCGLGETIARCSPTSALSNVDFPTLGRPARTTLPQRGMLGNISHEPTSAAQVQNRLLPMSREGAVDDILEQLGPILMEGRARLWAAYFAPVAK